MGFRIKSPFHDSAPSTISQAQQVMTIADGGDDVLTGAWHTSAEKSSPLGLRGPCRRLGKSLFIASRESEEVESRSIWHSHAAQRWAPSNGLQATGDTPYSTHSITPSYQS